MMKKYALLMCCVMIPGLFGMAEAQSPFSRGVNITGWFQTTGARQVQFSKYTKTDFENIKSLGCDVIRLPVNLFAMTSGEPDYSVDSLFFHFLDQVVDWAEELELYLILDNHTTDDLASRNPDLEEVLIRVWQQMASHYKDRSSYILYEIMNEPNGITTAAWSSIQQAAIDAIREVDTTHTLVVGASGYNTYNEMKSLPVYTDQKLIYTFHFYDPFLFTHQGATWPTPSLGPLAGIPFPYLADSMPPLPDVFKGTWIESAYNNYDKEGTVARVRELIDIAVDFRDSRNAIVYCGELGTYIPYCRDTNRTYWYSEVRQYLEANDIAWTMWDYKGDFGLFEKGSNEMFDYDLNIPLVGALGLNQPPQYAYESSPDTAGFMIYSDYIGEHIVEASIAGGGKIDFYSGDKPNNGDFCLSWTGASQYGTIGFNFVPDKDMSRLAAEGYAMSLMVRGNAPGTNIDLRFLDTKTSDPADHPWRMHYVLGESDAEWDGHWHPVYIPLSGFSEMGSWDNGSWYNPIGAYDWEAVDRFEIVTEQGSMAGKVFWFDNIAVTNQDTAQVYDTSVFVVPEIPSFLNTISRDFFRLFPNPFNSQLTIQYQLSETSEVSLVIFDVTGREVETLSRGIRNAGTHVETWDAENLPEGVYFCRLTLDNVNLIQKIIRIR